MNANSTEAKILIAGMGNTLRRDDGFGIVALNRLADMSLAGLPVKLLEVGIAGISLVQELTLGYQGCIILDAVDQGGPAGQIYRIIPNVPDLSLLGDMDRREYVSDTHYTVPIKALAMARAIHALPQQVVIIGCQPESIEELEMTLSPPVANAIDETVRLVIRTVEEFLEPPDRPASAEPGQFRTRKEGGGDRK